MPSPIAHLAAGYGLGRTLGTRLKAAHLWPVVVAGMVLALLPDLDSAAGVLFGDLGRFHNGPSHSLLVGVGVAVLASIAAGWWLGRGWWAVGLLVLASYELHVLMDFFTVGRGVQLLWPLSAERFSPPVPLFYGLHWSQGWWSHRHLWTLISEGLFALAVVWLVRDARARPPYKEGSARLTIAGGASTPARRTRWEARCFRRRTP